MASTKAQVDDLAFKFEKSVERLIANKELAVKRRAAETDVLKIVESVRNVLQDAVKGDRDELVQIFGGSCERFWRFQNAMDLVEFSDANAADPRWQQTKDAMLAIRHVLEDLGSFKSWLINMSAPSSLTYDIPNGYLEPDVEVKLLPQVLGCEAETLSFLVDPPLPDSLRLDAKTGEISGQLSHDHRESLQIGVECKSLAPVLMRSREDLASEEVAEIPQGARLVIETLGEGRRIKVKYNGSVGWISSQTKNEDRLVQKISGYIYTIRASNAAGIASYDLDLSGPSPDFILYEGLPTEYFSCVMGTRVSWAPNVKGGVPSNWSVEPPLPEGLQLDPQTGIIFGAPASRQKPTKFEISGRNACGSAQAVIQFGVISLEEASTQEDAEREDPCEAADDRSDCKDAGSTRRKGTLEDVDIDSSSAEGYSSDEEHRKRQGSMCTESAHNTGVDVREDDEVADSIGGGDPDRVVRLEWRKSRRLEHNGWTSHSTLQARLGDGNYIRLERFADQGFTSNKFASRDDISDEGELYRNLIAKVHEIKRPTYTKDLARIGKAIEAQHAYSLRSANCHHFVRDLWNDCVIEPLQCRHYPDRIKGGLLRGVTKPLGIFSRGQFASRAKPQPGALVDSDDELANELCRGDNSI